MASPMTTGYANPQVLPNRLPKLSYRTKSCDTVFISSTSTGFARSTASTTPPSPLPSDSSLSPRSPLSEMSHPSNTSHSSSATSSMSSKRSSAPPKKRPNLLSGLLGVKEPSAQALQDYHRHMIKQGGGRVNAVGMPGVSSAKLPATVPKVNSKWNGVPQTLKEKEKEKQRNATSPSMPGLSRQSGTSRSIGSERRAMSAGVSSGKRLSHGTLDEVSVQSGSNNNLADLYGWETTSCHGGGSAIDFAAEHKPSSSRATSSWSVPSLQHNSPFSLRDPPRTPVIPSSYTEFPTPSPPALSYSPTLTPYDSSPATPDASSPFLSLTSPVSEATHQKDIKTTVLVAPGSAEVIVKSAGVNILGPPAAAKRKPRPTPLQPGDQPSNTSGAEFPFRSMLGKEAPIQKDTPPPCPSLASYFPSTTAISKLDFGAKEPAGHNSTCERLGMGTDLKPQITASRQSPEQGTDLDAEGERIITPTPQGGPSMRKKSRMNMFKK